jgi:hypothetical protein
MVFEELDSRWQRAMKRAQIRGISPVRYQEGRQGPATVRRYFVDSGSRDGYRHSVRIAVDANGVDVVCTCEGSLSGHICWHAASVRRVDG